MAIYKVHVIRVNRQAVAIVSAGWQGKGLFTTNLIYLQVFFSSVLNTKNKNPQNPTVTLHTESNGLITVLKKLGSLYQNSTHKQIRHNTGK